MSYFDSACATVIAGIAQLTSTLLGGGASYPVASNCTDLSSPGSTFYSPFLKYRKVDAASPLAAIQAVLTSPFITVNTYNTSACIDNGYSNMLVFYPAGAAACIKTAASISISLTTSNGNAVAKSYSTATCSGNVNQTRTGALDVCVVDSLFGTSSAWNIIKSYGTTSGSAAGSPNWKLAVAAAVLSVFVL